MILVKPSHQILKIMGAVEDYRDEECLQLIELAGRTCYKSEKLITSESAQKFVQTILKNGHESVIEHSAMTVKFICDRGVTHELVRHRLCAFSQESTRYVNYKGGCTFVIPPWVDIKVAEYTNQLYLMSTEVIPDLNKPKNPSEQWFFSMLYAESGYQYLINKGWSPQQARSILPNSTKTEIVVTANFREWRHIFELRTSSKAHPQMQEIMRPLLDECKKLIPVIFDDISY
jgi:thymidylate synthase (FAD)